MLLKIAWRNVWRVPVRSFVVIGAVAVGVWAVISLMSFSYGMVESYVQKGIRYQTSHIQLHHPQFLADREVRFFLENAEAKADRIEDDPKVEAVTVRTLVTGMISTAKGSRAAMVRGIEPEQEAKVTSLAEKVVDGNYFSEKENEVLLGKPLAKKLGLKPRKKIVLQFQTTDNQLVAGAFRVAGLYDTGNTMNDVLQVFVKRNDLNRLLGKADAAHEIALFLNETKSLESTQISLQNDFPSDDVLTYRDLSPDIQLSEASMSISSAVFITIFMLALIFGIINTMLMAVLERTRELGMLMAVGMNKSRVFRMILLETLMLSFAGAPIGLGLGWLTVLYFKKYGLDLSAFSEGLRNFGMDTIVYPSINGTLFLQLVIGVTITAILASIYPALKAIRLRPMEAIRKL